jgi:hypothetical protein
MISRSGPDSRRMPLHGTVLINGALKPDGLRARTEFPGGLSTHPAPRPTAPRPWTIIEGRAASRISTVPDRLSGKSELQTVGSASLGIHQGFIRSKGLVYVARTGSLPEAPWSCVRLHIGKAARWQRRDQPTASQAAAQASRESDFQTGPQGIRGRLRPSLSSGWPGTGHCWRRGDNPSLTQVRGPGTACSRRSSCPGRGR